MHINLVSIFLISSLGYFNFSEQALVTFIVSMSITHTYIDFIPSIFLGAPEEDTFLSVLPGHQMLKQGLAHEAVVLSLYGSFLSLFIIFLFIPVLFFFSNFFFLIQKIIPYTLIFLSFYMVFREKNVFIALIVFLFSGILGLISFNLPVAQPLFPLLTGLFGTSSLLITIKQNPIIPKQSLTNLSKIKVTKTELKNSLLGAFISAPLCSFFPGLGAGHAGFIGSEVLKQNKRSFLMLLGMINTIVMGISFAVLFLFERTRTGSAIAISKIIELSLFDFSLIGLVIIFSGISSFFIALKISKFFSRKISLFNYKKISITVLIFLFSLTFILTDFIGIIILITSTSIGVFCILSKIKRINLMGVLIMPSIISYI